LLGVCVWRGTKNRHGQSETHKCCLKDACCGWAWCGRDEQGRLLCSSVVRIEVANED
jgi:hypothetical protein